MIYTVDGFVEKNKDTQQDVFFELLAQSENDFVGDLTRFQVITLPWCLGTLPYPAAVLDNTVAGRFMSSGDRKHYDDDNDNNYRVK